MPAKLATGSVELEGFNRNRHTKQEPKPVDRTLTVMRLDDATDEPIAVLVNFSEHPTSVPEQTLKFSADYAGALKTEIEKGFGGTAIFMQGASGDLSINKGSNPDHIGLGQSLDREAVKLATTLKPSVVERPSLKVREERRRFESRSDFNNPLIRMA